MGNALGNCCQTEKDLNDEVKFETIEPETMKNRNQNLNNILTTTDVHGQSRATTADLGTGRLR